MDTGSRKWGRPYLNRRFFSLVGERMGDRILLVMAKRGGRYIAGAINFIGGTRLYGRNWGCIEDHPFLHFEVCYYQAIDFAIARGRRPGRGWRPGRTQAGAGLPSRHHHVGSRLRRPVVQARGGGLPGAGTGLCPRGRRGAGRAPRPFRHAEGE
jgi:predicted N-acyltransferase